VLTRWEVAEVVLRLRPSVRRAFKFSGKSSASGAQRRSAARTHNRHQTQPTTCVAYFRRRAAAIAVPTAWATGGGNALPT